MYKLGANPCNLGAGIIHCADLKVSFGSEFPWAGVSNLSWHWMGGAIDVEEGEFGVWFVDEL